MKKFIILIGIIIAILTATVYFSYRPRCSPWRNRIGYLQLCNELNGVRNCGELNCNGTTIIKTKFLLENSSGSIFTFGSTQTVTILFQNQIITQANIWATANAPISYTVNHIKFIPNIITSNPSQTYAGIDIEVQYKKCGVKLPQN